MKDALQKVLGAGIGGPAGLSTLQAFLTSWSHACPRGRRGEFWRRCLRAHRAAELCAIIDFRTASSQLRDES
jgi:hypothetical protein